MHQPPDPEIAATLARRALIFQLIGQLQSRNTAVSTCTIVRAMRDQPPETFMPADYLWVEVTLTKRTR